MKCPICGSDLESHRGDYSYSESGLPNVTLMNLELHSCSSCGEEMASIPKIEELHRVLAFSIAMHPSKLSGSEVRFLRKYLGWSGKDFASTMGVAPETVSRWENSKEKIGLLSDRLLRMMVLRLKPVEEYPTERLSELGTLDEVESGIDLAINDGEWESLELAA